MQRLQGLVALMLQHDAHFTPSDKPWRASASGVARSAGSRSNRQAEWRFFHQYPATVRVAEQCGVWGDLAHSWDKARGIGRPLASSSMADLASSRLFAVSRRVGANQPEFQRLTLRINFDTDALVTAFLTVTFPPRLGLTHCVFGTRFHIRHF